MLAADVKRRRRIPSVDNARRTGSVFSGAVCQSPRHAAGGFLRFDPRSRGDGTRTGINRSDTKSLRTRAPSGRSPSYLSPDIRCRRRIPSVDIARQMGSVFSGAVRQSACRAAGGFFRFDARARAAMGPARGSNHPCSDTKSLRTRAPSGRSPSYVSPDV